MFELKLKTGVVLKVDTVEERYTNRGETIQKTLIFRINSDTIGLEGVLEILKAEGALSEILVTDEVGIVSSFTAYQSIQSVSRALVLGGANLTISLEGAE